VKIKLVSSGMAALLKSPEVLADLQRRAEAIAGAAGPGMEASSTVGRRRALAMVRTATPEAIRAEATSRALTSAIDAGRN
jgi:hypothetical protein